MREAIARLARALAPGLEELRGLAAFLKAEGLEATFVRSPVNDAMVPLYREMAQGRDFDDAPAAARVLAEAGMALAVPPASWPRRLSYDQEHMTRPGAVAYAGWVRGAWHRRPGR